MSETSMMRAPKVCANPQCPALARPGISYCDDHAPKPWASSNRRAELPRGWAKTRARILRRDPICTICGMDFSTQCHHVDDKHDHRDSNLAGVCQPCHTTLTTQQAAQARRTNP
jgi:5-methylcytosine-specific restriction protein A